MLELWNKCLPLKNDYALSYEDGYSAFYWRTLEVVGLILEYMRYSKQMSITNNV